MIMACCFVLAATLCIGVISEQPPAWRPTYRRRSILKSSESNLVDTGPVELTSQEQQRWQSRFPYWVFDVQPIRRIPWYDLWRPEHWRYRRGLVPFITSRVKSDWVPTSDNRGLRLGVRQSWMAVDILRTFGNVYGSLKVTNLKNRQEQSNYTNMELTVGDAIALMRSEAESLLKTSERQAARTGWRDGLGVHPANGTNEVLDTWLRYAWRRRAETVVAGASFETVRMTQRERRPESLPAWGAIGGIEAPSMAPGMYMLANIDDQTWESISARSRPNTEPSNSQALPWFASSDEGWMQWCLPRSTNSTHSGDSLRDQFVKSSFWRMLTIGAPGAGMLAHRDSLRVSSFQLQQRGAKRWLLCPPNGALSSSSPGAGNHSYIANDQVLQRAIQLGIDMTDIRESDYARLPLLRRLSNCFAVDVQPGEMLYYPADYWHATDTRVGPWRGAAVGSGPWVDATLAAAAKAAGHGYARTADNNVNGRKVDNRLRDPASTAKIGVAVSGSIINTDNMRASMLSLFRMCARSDGMQSESSAELYSSLLCQQLGSCFDWWAVAFGEGWNDAWQASGPVAATRAMHHLHQRQQSNVNTQAQRAEELHLAERRLAQDQTEWRSLLTLSQRPGTLSFVDANFAAKLEASRWGQDAVRHGFPGTWPSSQWPNRMSKSSPPQWKRVRRDPVRMHSDASVRGPIHSSEDIGKVSIAAGSIQSEWGVTDGPDGPIELGWTERYCDRFKDAPVHQGVSGTPQLPIIKSVFQIQDAKSGWCPPFVVVTPCQSRSDSKIERSCRLSWELLE